MNHTFPTPELIERCRELRHNPTPAEAALWAALRNRGLDGLKFRRQHPMAGFILDFYCEELKLAIEVDGEVHLEADQKIYDLYRTEMLKESGVHMIRFWNEEVLTNIEAVLERICKMAEKLEG